NRTEKSYRAMVYGEGPKYSDPIQAVQDAYHQEVYDEFIEPTVLVDAHQQPVGRIQDHDAVIFYNFRPDRAIQISQAMTHEAFEGFDRGDSSPKDLCYVCMT